MKPMDRSNKTSRFAITICFMFMLAASLWMGLRSHHKPAAERGQRLPVPPVKVDTIYLPSCVETIRVAVPAVVDTARVLASYFEKHAYRDTVKATVKAGPAKGQRAEVVIKDTVWQNAITGREVNFTFYPKRLVRDNSVGLSSTFGFNNLTIMAEYRYRCMKMYAGYNLIDHAPVAGVGFQLFSW